MGIRWATRRFLAACKAWAQVRKLLGPTVQINETGPWVELGRSSLNGYEHNALYKNLDSGVSGTPQFTDVGFLTASNRVEDGRAAAFLDIEGDGDIDVLIQSFAAPVKLLVNQGDDAGNWLQVKLRGAATNTDGIGAR